MTTPLRGLELETENGCRILSEPDLGYADGAEPRLLEIVSGASDLSSHSQELADAATDWGTTYSLVPTRANVARALDLPAGARVLEIGCGCGPITRYLGETCAVVDSIEPMPARAAVARARTRDLDNVEIYVGTLDDVPAVPTYDVVMVIGVLEYVGRGVLDPAPYLSFLRQCHAVLADGGTLVVAIENPLGVKYISGAVEDHTNRPFDSLEGYLLQSPARTFPRRTLDRMLADAGFSTRFLGAFPDYKLPRAVMSDALFGSSEQLVQNLPRFPSPDYLVPRLQLSDERATWASLVASGVAEHFANSFIALAAKGQGPSLWSEERQAVLFASVRQPRYALRADIRSTADGLVVQRAALYPDVPATEAEDVRHEPSSSEPVVPGRDLLQVVLDEPDRRADLLRRWAELVPDEEWAQVDLVPHNVVVTDDDRQVPIDQEWRARDYPRELVLFRGIYLAVVQLASWTRPERWQPSTTVEELVGLLAADIGLPVDQALVDRFVARESSFMTVVNTTDRDPAKRQSRAAEELLRMYHQSFDDVRGGARFDVQWARAMAEIDALYAADREREARLADVREKYEAALAEKAAEAEVLRKELVLLGGRGSAALARRVARGVLAKTGVLPRR
jgi:SAM-dependent methyltransferase